jgi:hypothetical protein
MALQRAKLGDIAYVAATAGSLYSNPTSTKTFIRGVLLFNGNTTVETVQLYLVPDAGAALGTAGVSNQIARVELQPYETLMLEFPYSLVLTDQNDSLQAVTTTASKVTAVVTGDKE